MAIHLAEGTLCTRRYAVVCGLHNGGGQDDIEIMNKVISLNLSLAPLSVQWNGIRFFANVVCLVSQHLRKILLATERHRQRHRERCLP